MLKIMNAKRAIARSVSYNEIVTLPYDAALVEGLRSECADSVAANEVLEFWGTTENGGEWRVHVSTADCVLVEVMPGWLRDTHRTARNWGTYPSNGAERRIMSREDAEELGEDEYDHVIRDARPSDVARYG